MVEMQLNRKIPVAPEEWQQRGDQAKASPQSEMMRKYEARRCHICQCNYPSFGFGSALTKAPQTIWACMSHRAEVDWIGESFRLPAVPI